MQRRICDLLAKGNTDTVVFSAVGIGSSTFYEWLQDGNAAIVSEEQGLELTEDEAMLAEFAEAVSRARDKAQELAVAAIRNAILGYDSEEVVEETWFTTEEDGKGGTIKVPHTTTKRKRWHTAPDARIALEFLSRRYPDLWAKKADIEINNNQNNLILNADDIAAALAQVLAKKQDTLRNYPELTDGDD